MTTGTPDSGTGAAAGRPQAAPPVWEQASLTPLWAAARDFRFLLARDYPRQASLTLVGNRYNLSSEARQVLHRGVFSPVTAARRRSKLQPLSALAGQPLALDGHNVLITLECALRGLPLVFADDGFIRDIGQVSGKFRPSPLTIEALWILSRYLRRHDLGPVTVYYDAPMSRSGDLAALTRHILGADGISGEARAVPVPEKHLLVFPGAVASSDTHLIDLCGRVTDPAGELSRQLFQGQILAVRSPSRHQSPAKLK